MKILIVSRRLSSWQSAPKCNVYLASALARMGHETHVLTTAIDPQAYQELKRTNVIIHKTPGIFANKQLSPVLYTLSAQKLKERFSVDVVLGNGYTLFDDVTWLHFLRLASIMRSGSRGWKVFAEAVLEKLLFNTSGLLLAPSSLAAEDLKKLYGLPNSKIVVQSHGVDVEYYSPLAEKQRSISEIEGEVRLLFIGADPFKKGFHLLLEGLARAKDRSNLKLIAVGFNPNPNVRLLVQKLGLKRMVLFEGIITAEKLRSLYQSSDIFVLPSLYDLFSLATLEAMATGLPVVVSHYAGVKDILCNWRDAVLVDPFDTNGLAEVLSILARDDELRRKIGINARHTAERFSWGRVAKNISSLLEGSSR